MKHFSFVDGSIIIFVDCGKACFELFLRKCLFLFSFFPLLKCQFLKLFVIHLWFAFYWFHHKFFGFFSVEVATVVFIILYPYFINTCLQNIIDFWRFTVDTWCVPRWFFIYLLKLFFPLFLLHFMFWIY